MATSEHINSKWLEDMRVKDLRAELEKRNLDKSGVKVILLERLKKAMDTEVDDTHENGAISANAEEEYGQQNGDNDPTEDSVEEHTMSVQEVGEEIAVSSREEINRHDDIEAPTEERIGETRVNEDKNEPSMQNEQQEQEGTRSQMDEADLTTEYYTMVDQEYADEQIYEGDEPKTEGDEPLKATDHVAADGDKTVAPVTGTAAILEDTINFMVDEDDNMLDEEMIYEDGTSNRPQEDSTASDSKDVGSSSDKNNASATDATSGSNKEAGGSTAENGAGDAANNEVSNGKTESSKKSASSSTGRDDKADDSKDSSSTSGRNLWVSGLSSTTRAQDLKSLFSKHGKVTCAKIVTSAKTPGTKCFGFVTMGSSETATDCIKLLNKSELHGRIIQVERAKGEQSRSSSRSKDGKTDKDGKTEDKRDGEDRRSKGSMDHSRDRRPRLVDRRYGAPRPIRTLGARRTPPRSDDSSRRSSPGRRPPPFSPPSSRRDVRNRSLGRRLSPTIPRRQEKEMLGINQIVEERERERIRARERMMREEERRAREEEVRQRVIERRQREESERLQREREQLRAERERIERQKQDLLRLEREQQRMEREKLEREREELRRQQFKLTRNDSSLGSKSSGSRYLESRGERPLKRPADDRSRGEYYDDRKRQAMDRPLDAKPRYADHASQHSSRSRYESSRDSHRYESSSSNGGGGVAAAAASSSQVSYGSSRGAVADVAGGSSSSRYDRHAVPAALSTGGRGTTSWMPPTGTPAAVTTSRRSDTYYEDRRGSGEGRGEGRVMRDYSSSSQSAALVAPPAPIISSSRGAGDSRSSRDSHGYSSSSSKAVYGSSSSSSSKAAYSSSTNGSSSSAALLQQTSHDGGSWRGTVPTAGRWSDSRGVLSSSSNNNNNSSSSNVGGSSSRGGATGVVMTDYVRTVVGSHPSMQSLPAPDRYTSSTYRKY